MNNVVHIKTVTFGEDSIVYIGRANARTGWKGSVLANPFVIGKDGDRAAVVEKYRKWLNAKCRENDPAIMAELKRIQCSLDRRALRLVCWCAPQACHGDVIINALRWLDTLDR
jgi:hypothetical protein